MPQKTQHFPTDPRLVRWLQAPGSLTSRLRQHGQVEVRVQQQGGAPLWVQECADLQVQSGYVREVVLVLDGRPAVWARSATSHPSIQGPWRAVRGLGSRPLAELLFGDRLVARDALQAHHLARRSVQSIHIRRQWQDFEQALERQTRPTDAPRWARSSVFWRHGQPLRVMEAFSPWLATLVTI